MSRSRGQGLLLLRLDVRRDNGGSLRFYGDFARGRAFKFCLAPAYQGQGLAREFLVQVLADMTDQGSESVFLEVRESNEAAIRLYLGCGFCEMGETKGLLSARAG